MGTLGTIGFVKSRPLIRLSAVVLGVGLLLVGLAALPAQATPSTSVLINSTVDLTVSPAVGTWEASGTFVDSGSLVEPRLNFVDNGELQITRVSSSSNGSFTLRITSQVSGQEPNGDVDFTGSWAIISGTGQYATLRGTGERTAVFHPASTTVTETLSGTAHFD
jgi:hypothetical protein